jgi:hypothetical protein
MSSTEKAVDNALTIGALAMHFASEPETIQVFTEWARKSHEANRNAPCIDTDCIYNNNAEEWHDLFRRAMTMCLLLRDVQ